jgi:dienelactone hydrolase
VRFEDMSYETDGRQMIGHFVVDENRVGPRPAVLLCHEGMGLDDHVKGRAVRLAGLGYAAFALDYHGGGQMLPPDEGMARLGELMADGDRTQRIARAGLDVLLARPEVDRSRVAAIGYCFGGAMAIELARGGADLQAVVGFHAGLTAPNAAGSRNIRASVLLFLGTDDPFVSADQRRAFEEEMREAGVADWRIEVYGGVGHSFTNPRVDEMNMPGLAFDATADRRSWRSMLDLFDEKLAPTD